MNLDHRWAIVEPVLRERIFDQMTNAALAELWLTALKEAGTFGLLLATSLAIDLSTQIIDAVEVQSYLCSVDPQARPLSVLNQRSSQGLRRDLVSPGAYEHGGYVRIVELRTFISRYLRRLVTTESVARVRREYLSDSLVKPLGEVRNAHPGKKGHTWVLPMAEYVQARNRDHPASFLNDALGLGMDSAYNTNEPAELLAIMYPDSFDDEHGGHLRQPNCFDATWDCENFYISHINEDGWGRTHSCSHRNDPHRERVHDSLRTLSDDFRVEHIGVAERPTKDLNLHLDEAIERLKRALSLLQ